MAASECRSSVTRRASRSVYCGVAGDGAPPKRSAGFTPRTPAMCSSAFIDARVRPDSSMEMYAFVYCGSATCAWVRPLAVRSERIRAPTSATMGDRTSATALGTLRGRSRPVKPIFTEFLRTETGALPVGVLRAQFGPNLGQPTRMRGRSQLLAETATTRVHAARVGNGRE